MPIPNPPPSPRQIKEQADKIHWEMMTPDQQNRTAKQLANVKVYKNLSLVFASLFVCSQPLLSLYFSNQEAARTNEIALNKTRSESAMAISAAAIHQVTELSSKQGELKAENESLRREYALLKVSFEELSKKYKELEIAYRQTLEEKKALEARIDQLFKNQSENKNNAPRN